MTLWGVRSRAELNIGDVDPPSDWVERSTDSVYLGRNALAPFLFSVVQKMAPARYQGGVLELP